MGEHAAVTARAWGIARETQDESTPTQLARLRLAFGVDGPNPTMTAGNSTPLMDGAAVVLLASEEWVRERGLEPLAYLTAYQTAAVDFVGAGVAGGEDGLPVAPAHAVPRAILERT